MSFFVLRNPRAEDGSTTTDFIPVSNAVLGDAPRCHACGRYTGLRPLLVPLEVDVELWGHSWGDVAFGPGDQLLISDKSKGAFENACIRGFERIESVTVRRVRRRGEFKAASSPKYWLATIIHGTGFIDDEKSGLRRTDERVCIECGLGGVVRGLKRVVLTPGSWSGEDVFYARGLPGTILVSKHFKDVVEASGLTGFQFENADDHELDFEQCRS
jgi:hypothetical protein